ncbi:MAG TPA: RHS repeat-associated core domain-containing protein [Steroidobacteraceae bacterium]|jgi:RHS repeat-associated protein|nr:RHS repeat-associated core domain-containing protein [Steroidobacteraceae bacterium]
MAAMRRRLRLPVQTSANRPVLSLPSPGDIPVATIRPSGSTVAIYYVHTDLLNTPHLVTRPSDNKQMWRWFPPTFGNSLPNTNPGGAGTFNYNLRYPGQIYDGQAGLHQNWNRDYDPLIGKYIQSDPLGLKAGVNTYSYVRSSPVMRRDPRGLVDFCDPFGECYINQPPACIYDETREACTTFHDPGGLPPVAACVIRKVVVEQLVGIPMDKAIDITIDKVLKGAAKQICKRTVTILGLIEDAYGVYVSYKECSECANCPTK